MSKSGQYLSLEINLTSEEKSKTRVLLIDSDGTIFHGNMKLVISTVIRFLKKSPEERGSIDKLLTDLEQALPLGSQSLFKSWLETQETIPWSKPAEELSALQQMIAGFFPLIQYHPGDDDTDAKPPCTALNVFDTVWEKQGIVMILTFNIYAPHTIRQALVQRGLAEKKAQQIYIIYPGSGVFAPHDRIYPCSEAGDGEMINKNKFIQKAQRICQEELKLTDCQYLFLDDQHARAAQSKSLSDVVAITGSYADGQHLWAAISRINGQRPASRSHTSVQPSPTSLIFNAHIEGEGSTPVLRSFSQSSKTRTLSTPHRGFPRELSNPELPSLQSPSPRGPAALALSTPRRGFPRELSNLELPSPLQPPSPPELTAHSSSVRHSSFFFPATAPKASEPTIAVEESAHHHRVGSARQEQLTPGLNPLSSLEDMDNRTTTEILEGSDTEVLSLMFPKPAAQTFNLAYARAQAPEQKIKAIVSAIKHFYPQTFHHLESSPVRLNTISPHWELHQWIQKLDELFVTAEENSPAQLQLVKTARTCWLELQFSLIGEIADSKNKPLSRDTTEEKLSSLSGGISEENIQFLFSGASEKDSCSPTSSPSSPAVVVVKELEKWHQRQLAIESSGDDQTPAAASACCCLIT
jgi:hypothetical protein